MIKPVLEYKNINFFEETKLLEMKEKLKTQTGTIEFTLPISIEMKDKETNLNIFKIVAGGHIYVFRKEKNELRFYHSSPGTGTRLAKIGLERDLKAKYVKIFFTWDSNGVKIYRGNDIGGKLIISKLSKTDIVFKTVKDKIFEFKGNVDETSLRFYSENGNIEPSAMENWKEIIKGLKTLNDGYKDFQHEVITVNLSLVSLVTGFESYLKKRFFEMISEGVECNEDALIKVIFTKRELEGSIVDDFREECKENGKLLIEEIGNKKINFQIYEVVKNVYKKTFNLGFVQSGIASSDIEYLKKIIEYRHKITHVSPMLPILNVSELATKNPQFPNSELISDSIKIFDNFIESIHKKSLQMKE